jgi:hypothetical protein
MADGCAECTTLDNGLIALWSAQAPTISSDCGPGLEVLTGYDYPTPDPGRPGDPPCPPSDPGKPGNLTACGRLNNLLNVLNNPLAGLYQNESQCAFILSALASLLGGLASPIVPLHS